MVRIDAHLHVFASASEQFPREPDDLAPAGRAEPVEKFIGCMEEHGIDQAMLVQMGGASIAHHAYLRHSIARYPDRFLGIGLVPDSCAEPEAHMDALAAQGGIVGFRLGALGGRAIHLPRSMCGHSQAIGSGSTRPSATMCYGCFCRRPRRIWRPIWSMRFRRCG